jgi:hypothetical protein
VHAARDAASKVLRLDVVQQLPAERGNPMLKQLRRRATSSKALTSAGKV